MTLEWASLAAHLQALAYARHAEVMAQEVVHQGIQQAVVEQQPMEALPQKHLAHDRLQQRLGLRSHEAFRAAEASSLTHTPCCQGVPPGTPRVVCKRTSSPKAETAWMKL